MSAPALDNRTELVYMGRIAEQVSQTFMIQCALTRVYCRARNPAI